MVTSPAGRKTEIRDYEPNGLAKTVKDYLGYTTTIRGFDAMQRPVGVLLPGSGAAGTPAERASDLAESMQVDQNGKREVKTRWRSVRAKGEVIRFL